MDLLVELAAKAFDCVCEPVKEMMCYTLSYKKNFHDVKEKFKELEDAEARVKTNVSSAENRGELIHQDVLNWLADVGTCNERVEILISRCEDKEQVVCLLGLCPDPKTRCLLSQEAAELLEDLGHLCNKAIGFVSVSYVVPPNGFKAVNSHHKDYMEFESRSAMLEQLMEALADAEVDTIGVHGMGGVGKTTLVREASERATRRNLFDKVMIVTVSWKPDIGKIQSEIADKLGLEFREQSESGRADRLCDRLKEFKRLLVVLDDMWSCLDLEKVGIPHGDVHKGCKLLLTSRSDDVLRGYMDAQKIVKVGVLQPKEAWKLFKKVAGDDVELPDLNYIADKIAVKCGGLPISIVTVAKALKDKGVEEWKNALKELGRPAASENNTDIPSDAYRSIEFSYDQLQGDDLKSVFLLCGYMGGYHIIDLVKYSVGLGVFTGVVSSMEETRNRVRALVRKLEASSLLLTRPKHDQFALHDVVRDVAISIVSKDTQIFVMREKVRPKEFPDMETLKNCTAITLFDVVISKLPDELKCPKLQFFHIFNKNPFLEIPENFFGEMADLRVVDLTNMMIRSLPLSLLNLANLRTLCLDHSVLGDISGIGKLISLEVLSFLWSEIRQLPEEIGELTNLKLLDLDHCTKLEEIPRGVISRLNRLEELYMNESFKKWDEAALAELMHLPRLTTFEAHIRDEGLIPRGLFTHKLVRYNVFIGDDWEWNEGYGYSRMLKLKHDRDQPVDDGVLLLLKKAEELYLDEYKGIGNIFCRLYRDGFPHLKYLHIQNNSEIEYLIDSSTETLRFGVFPMLESLSLYNVVNLKTTAFEGDCVASCFRTLRSVKVEKCEQMRSLFPLCVSKEDLAKVEVIDCESIVEIFVDEACEGDEVDDYKEIFLRFLTLKYLPALVTLCSIQSLPSTSKRSGQESVPLFNEKFQFPRLESLELVSLSIKTIWKTPSSSLSSSSSSFAELAKLTIDGCECLEYVLPLCMIPIFKCLKQLEISNCKNIRQIIFVEDSQNKTAEFPQLVILKMDNLESLTSFFTGHSAEFPELEHLQIRKCPKLKELIGVQLRHEDLLYPSEAYDFPINLGFCYIDEYLLNAKTQMPKLKELRLSSLEITNLWPRHTGFSDHRLGRLIVENCNRLTSIFPSYMVQNNLTRLAKLDIRTCSNVESIVVAASGLGKIESVFKFHKLDDLKLENLTKLKRFCDGERIDLPRLKKLLIQNCLNMKSFITDSVDIESSIVPLFDEKVGLQMLGSLTISKMEKVREIWKNSVNAASFNCLTNLKVEKCPNLSNIFPAAMLSVCKDLERLRILHCASLRVLFESEAADESEASMEEAGGAVTFTFPRVTSLELRELPQLQGFYSGGHDTWPWVKTLNVSGCKKMEPFVRRSLLKMDPTIRPVVYIN